MSSFQDILDAARALTTAERFRLVGQLWDDVAPADWPLPSEEWIAEAQRRSAEYDAGRMPASPWVEVRERARRKANLDA